MLKLIIISVLSLFIGTPEAQATTIESIKKTFSPKYKECKDICTKTCGGANQTLQEQKACWKERDTHKDKCKKSFFKIPACDENSTTANYRGATEAQEIIEQIYEKFPKFRVYFDQKDWIPDTTKLNTLTKEEQSDLKANLTKGIDLMLQYSKRSIEKMKEINNPYMPPNKAKKTIEQFESAFEGMGKIKNIVNDDRTYQEDKNAEGKELTKLFLKNKISELELLFKNIANQGSGFKWELENQRSATPQDCKDFCKTEQCLTNESVEAYCPKNCKKCNDDEYQKLKAQRTPWTKATPKPTKGEKIPFGSRTKEKTETMGKSDRSQITPPPLPPRPQQLPNHGKFPQKSPPPRPDRFPNTSPPPLPAAA